MGDLVRFTKPADEKLYKRAGESVKNALVSTVCNENGGGAVDDLSIGLVRGAYEIFYFMQEKGLSPEKICNEIDWVMEHLQKNLPSVKQNVWNWSKEE